MKLSSKWMKYLNIRQHTLNLIEEKQGNRLELIGTGKGFLKRTLIVQEMRTIETWNLMKLKASVWQRTPYLDKVVAYRIGKDLYHLHVC